MQDECIEAAAQFCFHQQWHAQRPSSCQHSNFLVLVRKLKSDYFEKTKPVLHVLDQLCTGDGRMIYDMSEGMQAHMSSRKV